MLAKAIQRGVPDASRGMVFANKFAPTKILRCLESVGANLLAKAIQRGVPEYRLANKFAPTGDLLAPRGNSYTER